MSKSNVLVIGFVLLIVGFALGHAVAPAPGPPIPPKPQAEPVRQQRPETNIFKAPETRDTPLGILRSAVLEPDAFARITRIAAVLPALGPEIVPEIRAVLADQALDPGAAGIDLMLRWWAKTDPVGAARWAMLKVDPGFHALATIAVVETWALTDPVAAAKHTQAVSLLPTASTKTAEIALVRGWFNSGLPGLPEYIQALGPDIPRQRAISVLARAMIQRDGTAAAIAWADSVPGDDFKFKLNVNRQVISAVARAEPEAAVAWCERICDGPFGSNTRSMVAQTWAGLDGRRALEWTATAPAGKERDYAVKAAFRGWFDTDRQGLYAWVEAMGVEGVEPWFQPTIEVLAISYSRTKPPEAVRWAGAITDEVARTRTYVTIGRNWRKNDPAAVDAWIEEMGFSEDVRERITAPDSKFRPLKPGAAPATAEDAPSDADAADAAESAAPPAETPLDAPTE